jgi:peptidyl-Lys metalloendopeptidase
VQGILDRAPMTGTDSRGGTLVHEITHFTVVAGTDDWVYDQAAAGMLAGSDPARAVDNADSHEYFRENEPRRNLRTQR